MNLELENYNNLCHFCLKKTKKLQSIFDKTTNVSDSNVNYLCPVDFISLITNYKINDEDDFPKYLCIQCSRQLKSFMIFRLSCINSFEHLHNVKSENTVTEVDNDFKEIPIILTNATEDPLLENTDDTKHFITNPQVLVSTNEAETYQPRKLKPSISKNKENLKVSETYIKEEEEDKDIINRNIKDIVEDCKDIHLEDSDDLNHLTSENDLGDDDSYEPPPITKQRKPTIRKAKKNSPTIKSGTNENTENSSKMKPKKKYITKLSICPICGISTRFLSIHMKIHTDEKPHACEHCDRSFKEKGNLKAHIKTIHLNLRPHKCNICGKGYNKKTGLEYHMVTHSGLKNYKCHLCGTKFALPTSLNDHVKRKHRLIRPFDCSTCGKKFLKKHELNIHSLVHNDEKPYQCQFCEKRYRTIGRKVTHETLIHKNGLILEPKTTKDKSRKLQKKKLNKLQQVQEEVDGSNDLGITTRFDDVPQLYSFTGDPGIC